MTTVEAGIDDVLVDVAEAEARLYTAQMMCGAHSDDVLLFGLWVEAHNAAARDYALGRLVLESFATPPDRLH